MMNGEASPSKKRFDAIKAKWETVAALKENSSPRRFPFGKKRLPSSISEPHLHLPKVGSEVLQNRIKSFTSISNFTSPLNALTTRTRRRDPELLTQAPPAPTPSRHKPSSHPAAEFSTAVVIRHSPTKHPDRLLAAMPPPFTSPKKHERTLSKSLTTSNLPTLARPRPLSRSSFSSSHQSRNSTQSRIPTPVHNESDQRSVKLAAARAVFANAGSQAQLPRSITQSSLPALAMPSRYLTPRVEHQRTERSPDSSLRGGGKFKRTSLAQRENGTSPLDHIEEVSEASASEEGRGHHGIGEMKGTKVKEAVSRLSASPKKHPTNDATPKAKYHLTPQQSGRVADHKKSGFKAPQLKTPRPVLRDTANESPTKPVTARKLDAPKLKLPRHQSSNDLAQKSKLIPPKPSIERSSKSLNNFSEIRNIFSSRSKESVGGESKENKVVRTKSTDSTGSKKAAKVEVLEEIPREVSEARCVPYWCGRFSTVDAELRKRASSPDRGSRFLRSSSHHQTDERRMKEAFAQLKDLCTSPEATKSLRDFMTKYAELPQHAWILRELPTIPRKRTPRPDSVINPSSRTSQRSSDETTSVNSTFHNWKDAIRRVASRKSSSQQRLS